MKLPVVIVRALAETLGTTLSLMSSSFSHVVFFPSVYHFTSNVHVELQSLAHLQVIVVSRNLVASEETAKDFHQTLKTYAEEARAQPGNLQ